MNLLPRPCSILRVAAVAVTLNLAASAATITFATDPFLGSDALTTPGRQIVGNELFTPFDVATDVFAFDPAVFGIGSTLLLANDTVENLPTSGINVIVLQTVDHDGDPTTPFLAGLAANLIAEQLTSPGPGFFIYFNSALDLPRLVYSTNLDDNTADLRILARLTNLGGDPGRAALPTFTAANFQIARVPETASVVTLVLATGWLLAARRASRRRTPPSGPDAP